MPFAGPRLCLREFAKDIYRKLSPEGREMKQLIAENHDDYSLIATGDGKRLEQFAHVRTIRPDGNVLWPAGKVAGSEWEDATAIYKDKEWWLEPAIDFEKWFFTFGKLKMRLRPTPFKHVGVFPEQRVHWEWLQQLGEQHKGLRVLNAFAYTGASTIVASQTGAHTTHVDASKSVVFWASENAKLSALGGDKIRWIVDDVLKFMRREVKRGTKYDVILMDPPVFGRGAKGEIWRLHEGLEELLTLTKQLLSDSPKGFLMNFYATEIYPESILRLAEAIFGDIFPSLDLYSVCLQEKNSKKALQTGFAIRS